MKTDLYIQDWASISGLGYEKNEIWDNYTHVKTLLCQKNGIWQGALSNSAAISLQNFLDENPALKKLDKTTQMGAFCADILKNRNSILDDCAVNAGSSRGATESLETSYGSFYSTGVVPTQTSPLTTAGNIASFIAQQIQCQGVELSHSITCSTFSHGLANANAWLSSGMAKQFIVAGTEAPLTPFTFAQMQALGIYSKAPAKELYPCQAYNLDKETNSMCLGEGAIAFLLNPVQGSAKYKISGIGLSKEKVKSAASVSANGKASSKAMLGAINDTKISEIDAIVSHSPGTILGDFSEYQAIKEVFGDNKPATTNNKWKIGHTFGASAGFSLELALLMLENKQFIVNPLDRKKYPPKDLNKILVNSIGFGGNAISILVEKA